MIKITKRLFFCCILFIFLAGVSAFSQRDYVLDIKILSVENHSDTYGKIYIRQLGKYVYRSTQLSIPANTTLTLDGEDNAIFYMTSAGECAYSYSFQYWEGVWPSYYLYNTVSITMNSDITLVAYYEETGPVCQTPTPLPSITLPPATPTPVKTSVPTPTTPPGSEYIPYLPAAGQTELIPSSETGEMYVDLTFPDAGYRIADPGTVAVAAGINPDGTTYLSYLTVGTDIEKYTGASAQVITTLRITYAINYGDTTYFGFRVNYNGNDQMVKEITIPPGTETTPLPATPVPTPEPTPVIIPTQDPGSGCTCDNGCDSALVVSIPYVKNGEGEACFITSPPASYMNSWNLKTLEVNGIDFTNRWVSASNLPAPINGKYYIYYRSLYPWGHFEMK